MLKLRDISEVCSMIQRLNSYNLLTDKVTKKVPYTIYRPDEKKQKKYRGVIKALKYKCCLSFRTCQTKIFKFADLTHTICWPTNIAKKQKIVEINLSIYVSAKHLPICKNQKCRQIWLLHSFPNVWKMHNLQITETPKMAKNFNQSTKILN